MKCRICDLFGIFTRNQWAWLERRWGSETERWTDALLVLVSVWDLLPKTNALNIAFVFHKKCGCFSQMLCQRWQILVPRISLTLHHFGLMQRREGKSAWWRSSIRHPRRRGIGVTKLLPGPGVPAAVSSGGGGCHTVLLRVRPAPRCLVSP